MRRPLQLRADSGLSTRQVAAALGINVVGAQGAKRTMRQSPLHEVPHHDFPAESVNSKYLLPSKT